MAQSYDFTEEEIRRKLEELGYSHIPADKLRQLASCNLSAIPKRFVTSACILEVELILFLLKVFYFGKFIR